MSNDEDGLISREDIFRSSVFKLGSEQVSAFLQLAHALRFDDNVSENTRAAANNVFNSIEGMLTQLNRMSEASWSAGQDSSESKDE